MHVCEQVRFARFSRVSRTLTLCHFPLNASALANDLVPFNFIYLSNETLFYITTTPFESVCIAENQNKNHFARGNSSPEVITKRGNLNPAYTPLDCNVCSPLHRVSCYPHGWKHSQRSQGSSLLHSRKIKRSNHAVIYLVAESERRRTVCFKRQS